MNADDTHAVLFNVQRFSTEDGPGIRTSFFFKGCPLTCPWCHNPEGMDPRPAVVFQNAACIDCHDCVDACPEGTLQHRDGVTVFDRNSCTVCGTCADACPAGAIEVIGRRYTTVELLDEALKDRAFYGQSGGGITLTGGEPLSQFRFLGEFLPLLKAEGIHVALDTSGIAAEAALDVVLPHVDMVLFDLKIAAGADHRDLVGVDIDRVIKAIKRVGSSGLPVWVRTPVIPGATDSIDNLRSLAKEAVSAFPGLERYELLAFSNICGSKYAMMDREFDYAGIPLMTADEMDVLADAVRDCGVPLVTWSGPIRSKSGEVGK